MKVLLKEYIHPEAKALLIKHAELTDDIDDIASVDAIILRSLPVTRELMQRAPRLKVIGKHGVGCNTIDLDAARELGITVFNTPTANTNSVAELIVGLILDIARNISLSDAKSRLGQFETIARASMCGLELTGKTLGLVGLGHIAQRVAEIMKKGFDMKTICYDPYISAEAAAELGTMKLDTVAELISASDVISISVPLTKGTTDLISGELFDCFKPNALLINASRGGIVNEDDLYDALKAGKLRAAACDAFVDEPPTGKNKLLTLENFCATPHLGADTEDALYRTGMEVVKGTIDYLNGTASVHVVV